TVRGFGQGQPASGVALAHVRGHVVGGTVDLQCAAVFPLLRYDPKSTGFFGNTPEPVVIRQGLASQTRCPVEDVDHGGVRGHPDLRARVKHVLDAMVDESVQLVTALTGAEFGHGAVHDLSGPAFGNDTLLPELGFS